MIGALHGLQDGLIHLLANIHLPTFLPLLIQLQTFYVNIYGEVQHWEDIQYGAQYLYPQACLVDQSYHGILKLIYSIQKGSGRLHVLPHCDQSPPW